MSNKILIFGICILVLFLVGCTSESTSKKTVYAGEEGKLDNGIDIVSVARTKEALKELNKAANAKDEIGYEQVFLSGKAFIVNRGTKVLVLDNDILTVKVRILEGEHINEVGWVPYEWVRKG